MSDVKDQEKDTGKETYPVLPLRDIVVFPYMIVPLFVGREKSINALEEVMRSDKHILLAAQKMQGTMIRRRTPSIRWEPSPLSFSF
jgi:ATP-dependent proteinase. Serine peptidase. MEROPS family S16